jgi:hypothetical protein
MSRDTNGKNTKISPSAQNKSEKDSPVDLIMPCNNPLG